MKSLLPTQIFLQKRCFAPETRLGVPVPATKIVFCLSSLLTVCALSPIVSSQTAAPAKRIVIAANTVLDGNGHVLHDTRIVIEGSRIAVLDPKAGPVDYDLRGLTVLPGWIDAHVHINWFFAKNGKLAGATFESLPQSERDAIPSSARITRDDATLASVSNVWVMLMAGFTTVQSVGSPSDLPLRDSITRGALPGPRILTANQPLSGQAEKTGTPDE